MSHMTLCFVLRVSLEVCCFYGIVCSFVLALQHTPPGADERQTESRKAVDVVGWETMLWLPSGWRGPIPVSPSLTFPNGNWLDQKADLCPATRGWHWLGSVQTHMRAKKHRWDSACLSFSIVFLNSVLANVFLRLLGGLVVGTILTEPWLIYTK